MNLIEQVVKPIIERFTPRRHRARALWITNSILYYGLSRVCPCCGGRFRKFLTFGKRPRPNAQCPRCGVLERHRLLWLYLRERTTFFTKQLRLLDFAPTAFFAKKCRQLKNIEYVSADLNSRRAGVHTDITQIAFPDDAFDGIICTHVLEHIPDDAKAMRELYRVLKPAGWAILNSRLDCNREETFEGPAGASPAERKRLFGMADHRRIYGLDYKGKLEQAGFAVTVDRFVKELDEATVKKHGLPRDEDIYMCTKPAQTTP